MRRPSAGGVVVTGRLFAAARPRRRSGLGKACPAPAEGAARLRTRSVNTCDSTSLGIADVAEQLLD